MLVRILLIIVGIVVVVLALGWLGFRIPAPGYPAVAAPPAPPSIPIPANLPELVLRFARATYGDAMPQVQSALVVGRATVIVNGITMPARLRISYDAGGDYYHEFEVTWFTLPIMRVHERYLDGRAILDIPIAGRTEDDPYINRAGNQGFWGETLGWVPAIVLADPRVRWEAVDANSARAYLPGADDVEAFTVRFDPATGLMTELTAMRYRDPGVDQRLRWTNRTLGWSAVNGAQIGVYASTQWGDDPPWAVWNVEQVILNADVSERFEHFGA